MFIDGLVSYRLQNRSASANTQCIHEMWGIQQRINPHFHKLTTSPIIFSNNLIHIIFTMIILAVIKS